MSEVKVFHPDKIDSLAREAWLGLGDTSKLDIKNRMMFLDHEDKQYPGLKQMRFMKDTNYLAYAAKTLLNVHLLPMQAAIVQELWTRPFCMFIGSRGFGKSYAMAVVIMLKLALTPKASSGGPGVKVIVCGAAFRQSKFILEYMDTIWRNAPLLRSIYKNKDDGLHKGNDQWTFRLGENWAMALPIGDGCVLGDTLVTYNDCFGTIKDYNKQMITPIYKSVYGTNTKGEGKFRHSDESYNNGIRKVKKITTKRGYSYGGTYNHKMQVLRNKEIVWCRTDEICLGDRILIDRSERWHNGNFDISDDEAYALGLMIGDGCWTSDTSLGYATEDEELSMSIKRFFGERFKQESDIVHYRMNGKDIVTQWKNRHGLTNEYSHQKFLPHTILSASKEKMALCIRGIFDTDGTLQVSTAKGGTTVKVSLTSTSRTLITQIQYILLHYGIISTISSRHRVEHHNRIYELHISGENVVKFHKYINFGLSRKRNILENGLGDKIRSVSMDDIIPDIKEDMLDFAVNYKSIDPKISYARIKKRVEITRHQAERFCNAYRHTNHPLLDKIKELNNPNIYYDVVTNIEDLEDQETYDIHIPDEHIYCANGFCSHNTKIRGYRANMVFCDEFNSINPEVYETVLAGFGAVSSDPVYNVKLAAARKVKQEHGLWTPEDEEVYENKGGNQAIISGTAGYDFEHFAAYYKRYRDIIKTKGDPNKLKLLFPEGMPPGLSWKDFSIIRIPYELIPEGFMDAKQVARARATGSSHIYEKEYGTIFVRDSDGFFKRSLIESCIASDKKPIILPKSGEVFFDPRTKGYPNLRYVIGIDPAYAVDNFSIVVLEMRDDHRRIVYCWSTNSKDFRNRKEAGLTKQKDYYRYCSEKIRQLIKSFPLYDKTNLPVIGMDGQGGGIAVAEALGDANPGEQAILPWIDRDKPKDTDLLPGKHILDLVQFARADWVSEANHGLRKDMEDKILLFPRFDTLTLELANQEDTAMINAGDNSRLYDSLEDCAVEIEELKDELCTIVMTKTGTGGVGGRDRWDTPEIKLDNGKKGRMRKDRYSALLIANMVARQIQRNIDIANYGVIGGYSRDLASQDSKRKGNQKLYTGADWYSSSFLDSMGRGINRRNKD